LAPPDGRRKGRRAVSVLVLGILALAVVGLIVAGVIALVAGNRNKDER
jgi:hypothetical protein